MPPQFGPAILPTRQTFFNDLRALTPYLYGESWQQLLDFMLEQLELVPAFDTRQAWLRQPCALHSILCKCPIWPIMPSSRLPKIFLLRWQRLSLRLNSSLFQLGVIKIHEVTILQNSLHFLGFPGCPPVFSF